MQIEHVAARERARTDNAFGGHAAGIDVRRLGATRRRRRQMRHEAEGLARRGERAATARRLDDKPRAQAHELRAG